jgi:hypothetical protein
MQPSGGRPCCLRAAARAARAEGEGVGVGGSRSSPPHIGASSRYYRQAMLIAQLLMNRGQRHPGRQLARDVIRVHRDRRGPPMPHACRCGVTARPPGARPGLDRTAARIAAITNSRREEPTMPPADHGLLRRLDETACRRPACSQGRAGRPRELPTAQRLTHRPSPDGRFSPPAQSSARISNLKIP